MGWSLRLAALEDVPAIERVVGAAYSPYVKRIGRKPGPMLDDYAALIRGQRVQVVAPEGEIRALLVLIPLADALLLDNVAVAPAFHGKGLGRFLLQAAEQFARDGGHRRIRLYTHEAMMENIALYRRYGFVETHRAEEKGLRRIYMEKLLG